ncbi:hypothetical protein GCM10010503_28480 [Streptomyces lucensis JCM 4490]|uniref:Uncharacterized protein n=1 Tax=Streptomyces lucensis JCM 4490 TaxID=1306176 RepID=A0A918J5U7_9ACTN|nr:hypothetical protein [Streptomyces lucensis]GGW49878.1 hypothetical protein GCM10010503_28480 [Streptomyces lucensis JCM 4490]
MSTEARHAPVPPRPSSPPGGTPPEHARQATTQGPAPLVSEQRRTVPDPGAPASSPRRPGPEPGLTAPPGPIPAQDAPASPGRPPAAARPAPARDVPEGSGAGRGAAPDGDDLDDEPSVFTPRASRLSVPEAADLVSPPPPPASARFPDAPPSTGRETRRPRPGARAGRPAAPAETAGETTARLRPVKEPPRRQAPAEGPAETTARLRPVPSAPPPSPPSHRPPGSTPVRSAPTAATAADRRTGGTPAAGPGGPPAAASAAARGHSPATAAGVGRPGLTSREAAWSPAAPARPAGPPPAAASSAPDPALSWSAGPAERPFVPFAEPEAFAGGPRPRIRPRTAAAAACLVLGLGLVGGAVTGSWLTGDGGSEAAAGKYATARTLWHSVPVDRLFPPTVEGTGAGPGGADRTWTRIAVAPDTGCAHAFDPLLHKVLAPVGCLRLLRATYTDATQSHVTTVGLLFTKADPASMSALARRFRDERLDRRSDLMPRPYAAKGTVAAGFGDEQRASWTVSVVTDAPVVAFAVSGWADGRTVDSPQPAADAVRSGATTAPAQAGLGNEAQGLADRIERRLRQTAGPAAEKDS